MSAKPKDDKMFSLAQVITICSVAAAAVLNYAGLSSKMEVIQTTVTSHEKRIGKIEEIQYAGLMPIPQPAKQYNQTSEAVIPPGLQFPRKRR